MSSGVETSLTDFHERRTQNSRSTRYDDGYRTSSSFGVSRTCDGDLKTLARSAIRRRAAGRERLLLRCRPSAPDLARGFRENRGGDEEGNQGESSVRAHGGFTRRSAGTWKQGTTRCAERTRSAEQVQDRHYRKHS